MIRWAGLDSDIGRRQNLVRKALAALVVVGAAFGIVGLWHPAPVEARSHSAVRSFAAPWILPGRLDRCDDRRQRLRPIRTGRRNAAVWVQLRRLRLVRSSGDGRGTDRRLHASGGRAVHVYGRRSQRGGFLLLLRSHTGRGQGRSAGWRRLHHTGRPRPHAGAYSYTHP